MQRKKIIALVLIALFIIMIVDFRINEENVIADLFMQFETKSMREITNMSSPGFNTDKNNPAAIRKSNFNYEKENIEKFNLDNEIGSVDIQGHNKDSIEISYEVKVYAQNREEAEDYLQEIKVGYEVTGNTFNLYVNPIKPKPVTINGYEVLFDIKVPKDLYIDLANKYGNIKVQNFISGLNLRAKYSSTIINFIKGDIDILNDYGSLNISDLAGQININTSYNKNDFKNIEGTLNIKSAYTDNYIENVYADTEINGRYGGGNLKNLKGNLDFDLRYMGLNIGDVEGIIKGKTEYGDINIESLSNNLDITSRYSDLKIWLDRNLRDVDVEVSTRHGDLKTDFDLPITEDKNTKNINGQLQSGDKEIRIDASYADIELIYEN